MRIFLDGLDAAGKSTFADKLRLKYDMNIMHSNGKDPNTAEYFNHFFDLDNVVYDRCAVGEMVYPIVYNRPGKISRVEFDSWMNRLILNNDYLILFVCSNMSIINNRLIAREEYDYLSEMGDQNTVFNQVIKTLPKYKNLYIIDIAEKDAYDRLDHWIDKKISEVKENGTI